MIFNIHVEPYEIKAFSEYKMDFAEKGQFPVCSIDRGSYINGAQIETSLNFHVEDGCYNLQIGKYCALAEDILFMMDLMHDYKYISMGAIEEFRDMPPVSRDFTQYRVKRKGQILIENDVWIGHGATIMGGVTIHNGAVVAANAVVTKDVPPYAIVAGNPAKIVKYRFEQEEIDALLQIAWWHWESDVLRGRHREMRLPVQEFINCFRPKAMGEETLNCPNPIHKNVSGMVYVCIADMEREFPVLPKIIHEFCERFHAMDGQLVIYINQDIEVNLEGITDALLPYQETDCSVQIIDGGTVPLIDVIKSGDCYITNRCAVNLWAVEKAYLYEKKVLSGVDIPIW